MSRPASDNQLIKNIVNIFISSDDAASFSTLYEDNLWSRKFFNWNTKIKNGWLHGLTLTREGRNAVWWPRRLTPDNSKLVSVSFVYVYCLQREHCFRAKRKVQPSFKWMQFRFHPLCRLRDFIARMEILKISSFPTINPMTLSEKLRRETF